MWKWESVEGIVVSGWWLVVVDVYELKVELAICKPI